MSQTPSQTASNNPAHRVSHLVVQQQRAGTNRFVVPFREVNIADVPTVGGKNASLGEMIRELTPLGVRVPDGFAVTASARKVGICGEAPSNYPDYAAWLAGIGIDSMSLNPDALPGVARTLRTRPEA